MTKNVEIEINGARITITVPVEANDSAAYDEIYRNNYKRYMK